ncbi:MAG: hypothetical protein ACREBU_12140 [Nitrososphaera sp.]
MNTEGGELKLIQGDGGVRGLFCEMIDSLMLIRSELIGYSRPPLLLGSLSDEEIRKLYKRAVRESNQLIDCLVYIKKRLALLDSLNANAFKINKDV